MAKFNIGDAIVIKAEIKKLTPFAATEYAYNDPSNGVTITIYDPDNNRLVSSAAMTKSTTGKYYYTWQTQANYNAGIYTYGILVDDTNDGYVEKSDIELI